jgi:hypothetical protein
MDHGLIILKGIFILVAIIFWINHRADHWYYLKFRHLYPNIKEEDFGGGW